MKLFGIFHDMTKHQHNVDTLRSIVVCPRYKNFFFDEYDSYTIRFHFINKLQDSNHTELRIGLDEYNEVLDMCSEMTDNVVQGKFLLTSSLYQNYQRIKFIDQILADL